MYFIKGVEHTLLFITVFDFFYRDTKKMLSYSLEKALGRALSGATILFEITIAF